MLEIIQVIGMALAGMLVYLGVGAVIALLNAWVCDDGNLGDFFIIVLSWPLFVLGILIWGGICLTFLTAHLQRSAHEERGEVSAVLSPEAHP